MLDENIIIIYKSVGLTPLEAVNKFKQLYPKFYNQKISYAGRLDPMAEGAMVLLVGEENKKRKKYENLDKVYVAEIAFGITTDSFDGLGMVQSSNLGTDITKGQIDQCLVSFLGKQSQVYPPYSSRTVQGKPLFWWSRNGKLLEITIPTREIEIFSIDLLSCDFIQVENLIEVIKEKIKKVTGDFRQKEIQEMWDTFLDENGGLQIGRVKIKVHCSSGTYIRRLASDIGEKLGTGAFLMSLKRDKVGDFTEEQYVIME